MRSVALLVSVVLLAGCTTAAVGTDAEANYAWLSGTLETTLTHPLPEVEEATREAFVELDLVAVDGAVDGLKGELTARMADGTKVRVKMKALDFGSTRVKIRLGTLGDKAASEQILRYIQRGLGEPVS